MLNIHVFWKIFLFLFYIVTSNIVSLYGMYALNHEDVSSSISTIRIYHLTCANIEDVLLEDVQKVKFCVVNNAYGCAWFSKTPHRTTPYFWNLVKEGTGIDLGCHNEEFWLYDIPNCLGHHFAIRFGRGDFFKKDAQDIDPHFGEYIHAHLTENPECDTGYVDLTNQNSAYCSVKFKGSVTDFMKLCAELFHYSKRDESKVLQYLHQIAKQKGKKILAVDEEELHVIETVGTQEEGEAVHYAYNGEQKTAVNVCGQYRTFVGFKEYIEQTRQDVQTFIDHTITFDAFVQDEMKTEAHYNKVTSDRNGYLCLDAELFENIEICDFWIRELRELVHVKIGTDSSLLNHLFGQGYASAALLAKPHFLESMVLHFLNNRFMSLAQKRLREKFETNKEGLWQEFLAWRTQYTQKELISSKNKKRKRENLEFLVHRSAFPSIDKDMSTFIKELQKSGYAELIELSKKIQRYKKDTLENFLKQVWDNIKSILPNKIDQDSAQINFLDDVKNKVMESFSDHETCSVELSVEDVSHLFLEPTFKAEAEKLLDFLRRDSDHKRKFKIVYAIATKKEKTDKRLLPLNARINFLRTANNVKNNVALKDMFDISLRIIEVRGAMEQCEAI